MKLVEDDVDPLALERQVCFALAVTNRAVLSVWPHVCPATAAVPG